jgi:hypothetical protein
VTTIPADDDDDDKDDKPFQASKMPSLLPFLLNVTVGAMPGYEFEIT